MGSEGGELSIKCKNNSAAAAGIAAATAITAVDATEGRPNMQGTKEALLVSRLARRWINFWRGMDSQ